MNASLSPWRERQIDLRVRRAQTTLLPYQEQWLAEDADEPLLLWSRGATAEEAREALRAIIVRYALRLQREGKSL